MYDPQYKELRDMVAKFSDTEVVPKASQIDHDAEIPKDLINKLFENGFMGSYIPEEFGGAGMDYTSYSIIVEEISRGCASTGVLISAHTSLCMWPILNFGTTEQKKKFLPSLSSGGVVGCFCLSEPNAGSDPGTLATLNFREQKTLSPMEKTQESQSFWQRLKRPMTIKGLLLLLWIPKLKVSKFKN
jgi:butyryl-CoA dehydrogenase